MNEVTPVPLAKTDPPVDAAYQSMVVPLGAVAERTTVPVPQREPSMGEVAAVGKAFTVAVTAVREADKQPVVEFLT